MELRRPTRRAFLWGEGGIDMLMPHLAQESIGDSFRVAIRRTWKFAVASLNSGLTCSSFDPYIPAQFAESPVIYHMMSLAPASMATE
ncbi:hypothetical protein GJAV_G00269570 [Gymnothorax javanicus]|nr:hypothetical protein GJAV_G00269570 [Gymnothorax javanicus]